MAGGRARPGALIGVGRTGAHLVVEALAAAGVRHLFSLSGNHILSLYDAALGRGSAH